MPDIFTEAFNKFLDAAKYRKPIDFWLEPFLKQLNRNCTPANRSASKTNEVVDASGDIA